MQRPWTVHDRFPQSRLYPLFHIAGSAWLFFGLAAGCRNDLVIDIDPSGILEQIEASSITCTLMVPAVIQMVTAAAEAAGTTVSGLKTIAFGASPMPAELLKRAQKVFPKPISYISMA